MEEGGREKKDRERESKGDRYIQKERKTKRESASSIYSI